MNNRKVLYLPRLPVSLPIRPHSSNRSPAVLQPCRNPSMACYDEQGDDCVKARQKTHWSLTQSSQPRGVLMPCHTQLDDVPQASHGCQLSLFGACMSHVFDARDGATLVIIGLSILRFDTSTQACHQRRPIPSALQHGPSLSADRHGHSHLFTGRESALCGSDWFSPGIVLDEVFRCCITRLCYRVTQLSHSSAARDGYS